MEYLEAQKAALREKQAKELAELEQLHKMQTAVASALNLPEEAFRAGWMHAYGADCHVELHAETLPDAILIAERMNPITACKVKDGSTSFLPDARIPEKRRERGTVEIICPYFYEVDGIAGRPEEKRLRFFVAAGPYVVAVRVAVKKDPDTHRLHHVEYNRHGEILREERSIVNQSGHFPQVVKWWSSPGQPGKYTLWSY